MTRPPALVASDVGTIGRDSKFTADQPVFISAAAPPEPPVTQASEETRDMVLVLTGQSRAATPGTAPAPPSEPKPCLCSPGLCVGTSKLAAGYRCWQRAGTPRGDE
jgi:hypothetical protein